MCCLTEFCHPGTYSASGYEPCNDCPYNHYQTEYGASECILCSNETDIEVCSKSKGDYI